MKIGIICADIDEVTPIIKEMNVTNIIEKAMLKIHEGTLWGIDTVALYCGACKVNAAVATQLVIDTFGVDAIINVGAAGGIDPSVKVYDTVISTEVAYHDIQPGVLTGFHPWMKSDWFPVDEGLLNAAKRAATKVDGGGRILFGRMVTGEVFIEDEGREKIISKFDPLCVDMETGSIAHVCYVNKMPFLAIRTITDTAEHSGSANYEDNLDKAVLIGRDITQTIFEELR